MADTLDVLSLTEAKQAVQKTGTSAYDTLLTAWITAMSRRLDRLAGPIVQRTISSELHDGGYERIYLQYHPITSITTITEYDNTTGTALTAETNASKPDNAYRVLKYSADPVYKSNIVVRRSANADAIFAAGQENIDVAYVPGRFANTAAVDERFKQAGRLMLKNAMRMIEDGTGQVGEYDVPIVAFPTFTTPMAVRDLLDGEIQDPTPL